MDIQVEALEGYTNSTIDPSRAHIIWAVYEYTFYGEESRLCSTQTVTLGVASIVTLNPTLTELPSNSTLNEVLSTPNWTFNPTVAGSAKGNQSQTMDSVPLTTFLLVFAFFIVIIAVMAVLAFAKHRKTAILSK
jgi:hypothetical protein